MESYPADMKRNLSSAIKSATKIEICSGEGIGPGTTTRFTGTFTLLAVDRRLARERCKGDRWAYAIVDGQRL